MENILVPNLARIAGSIPLIQRPLILVVTSELTFPSETYSRPVIGDTEAHHVANVL